jgi:hypothetical protein
MKDERKKKEREPRFLFHEFCDVAKVVSIPKQIFGLVDNTCKERNYQNNTSRHKCDDCAEGKKNPPTFRV